MQLIKNRKTQIIKNNIILFFFSKYTKCYLIRGSITDTNKHIKHTQTNPYIGKVSEMTLSPLYMRPHFKLLKTVCLQCYYEETPPDMLTCIFIDLWTFSDFKLWTLTSLQQEKPELWWYLNPGQRRFKGVSSERSSLRSQRPLSEWTYSLNNPQRETGSFFRFLWPFQLDVVGLGVIGRKKVAGAHGHWRVGPPASPTAQESTTGRSEESTNPAHKHGITKLRSAKKSRATLM